MPKAKSQKPKTLKDIEVVFCDWVGGAFYVGYSDPLPVRKFASDWIFDFRANVPANDQRGIEAFTYFAQWRIAPKLPGRLAAIVALKERAMKKGIELLEVFGMWGPQ